MPLELGHETMIKAGIGYLLDSLPTEENQLAEEIIQIKEAFSNSVLKPDHPYKGIQKPTEFFFGLEEYGKQNNNDEKKHEEVKSNPIKIGDVKTYLLKLFDEKIVLAANEAKFDIKDIWNKEQIQKTINEDNEYKEIFKSKKPRLPEPEPPYSIPRDIDQIYRGNVYVDDKLIMTKMHLEINIPSEEKIISDHDLFAITDEMTDEGQHDYLLCSADQSRQSAINLTINEVIKYLIAKKILTDQHLINFYPFQVLLSYKTYIDAIIENKISINQLIKLNHKQVCTLQSQVIIKLISKNPKLFDQVKDLKKSELKILSNDACLQLIQEDICDIDVLQKLNKKQIKLISESYYLSLLRQRKLSIEKIRKLSPSECENLYHPSSINLIKSGKASIDQIQEMTEGTKLVISNEYFEGKIQKGELTFENINYLDEQTGLVLTTPSIINLLNQKVITLNQVIKLSSDAKRLIIHDELIRYFLNMQIIKLDDTNNILNDNELPLISTFKFKPEYDLELMSNLPNGNRYQAEVGTIYLSETGSYIVRDLVGTVQTGTLKNSAIDLKNLSSRIRDKDLKKQILVITSKAGHTFMPTEASQLDLLKRIITQAISLCADGFLYREDLHYIYKNFTGLAKQFKPSEKDEKKQDTTNKSDLSILLEDPFISRRYKTNIKHRLLSVSNSGRSVWFTTNKIDSLQQIFADCQKNGIDLNQILHEELDTIIHNGIFPRESMMISKLLYKGKKLGLNDHDILGHLFGSRIESIYNDTPHIFYSTDNTDVKDCIKTLNIDINVTAKNMGMDAELLQDSAAKYFLKNLKSNLSNYQESKVNNLAKLAKEIIKTISEAEKMSSENISQTKKPVWLETLKKITTATKYCHTSFGNYPVVIKSLISSNNSMSTLFLGKSGMTDSKIELKIRHGLQNIDSFCCDLLSENKKSIINKIELKCKI